MSNNTKKVGVPTNVIINTRYEKAIKKKNKKIHKGKNCKKCIHFNIKSLWCGSFGFRVTTIELGNKCKNYTTQIKSSK